VDRVESVLIPDTAAHRLSILSEVGRSRLFLEASEFAQNSPADVPSTEGSGEVPALNLGNVEPANLTETTAF
jgi:hypothetical protein